MAKHRYDQPPLDGMPTPPVQTVVCPVCRQMARLTERKNVGTHNDTAGKRCVMTGQPFPYAYLEGEQP
jgi:hypothetical protein